MRAKLPKNHLIIREKAYATWWLLSLLLLMACSKDNIMPEDITENSSGLEELTSLNLSDGFKAVLLQPIIITNNSGTASFTDIDIEKINHTYSTSKVQFVMLKPKSVKNDDIYNGSMGLNLMKTWLTDHKHLVGQGNVVNLVCTENLLGSGAPRGMAETPGSITFVVFDSNPGSIINVFVVCHEVGHNFGLRHANQDSNVPNDVPNVMGEGAYKDRLNPENSFNDYQIGIINQAAIVHSEDKALELIEKYSLELQ